MATLKPKGATAGSQERDFVGYRTDTIVAQATPPGWGGVSVVRLSGPDALQMAKGLFDAPLDKQPRHAFLVELRVPGNRQLLDQALVTYFQAPASFTGEEVVEFSAHGGHVSPARIIRALTDLGARQAGPGEFSLRAYLNGKLDLAEAEALNQVVKSLSLRGQATAFDNLTGRLSKEITALREDLLQLLTILEHELDFSEDEIDAIACVEVERRVHQVKTRLQHLKSTAPYGRIIRDGARVILAGPPNAGKSSLFNALIGHERAIVTETPGTTRDSLEAWIDMDGFPVCLVDTAGISESQQEIERLGVERSKKELLDADIILLLDPQNPLENELDPDLKEKTILYIQSKVDQTPPKGSRELIRASIKRTDGLDELLIKLRKALKNYVPGKECAIVASERQLAGIDAALTHLGEVNQQLEDNLTMDIVSAEIRLAVNSLSEIIGETTSEDVILRIFSEFCVGK